MRSIGALLRGALFGDMRFSGGLERGWGVCVLKRVFSSSLLLLCSLVGLVGWMFWSWLWAGAGAAAPNTVAWISGGKVMVSRDSVWMWLPFFNL